MVRKDFTEQTICEQKTERSEGVSCANIWNVPEAVSGKGAGLGEHLEFLKVGSRGRAVKEVLWVLHDVPVTTHVHVI